MSQGGSGGDGQELGPLWDGQPWGFHSNSGNSGDGSDHKTPTAATSRSVDYSCSNSPGTTASVGEKRTREDDTVKESSSKDGGTGGSEGKALIGDPDHEIHIWTERERRKKMRNMFSSLHALLPQLPPKADKSTIVDEAINYIKTLRQNLQNLENLQNFQKLQKQKLERMLKAPLVDRSTSALATALQSIHGIDQFMNTREATLADHAKSWPTAMSSPTAVSITRFPQCFQTWSSPNVVLSVSGEDAHINICAAKKPGVLSTVLYVLEKHKLEVLSATISSDFFRILFMIHCHAIGASDRFPDTLMIEEMYKLAVSEIILWLTSQ